MGIYINRGNAAFRQYTNGEYVDKTAMIAYINTTVDTANKLTCVSRPRRFGKSMAAHMLYAYYDKSCDSRELFSRFAIAKDKSFEEHLNKYPTIYLDITDFTTRYQGRDDIVELIQAAVIKDIRKAYPDVEADEGCDLMDMLLNVYMTGILPIKRYGTQSELNDFREYSMASSRQLAGYIGFTEPEVRALCDKHGMDYEDMKGWYDGYSFGPDYPAVFNPNSVMLACGSGSYENYWGRTSAFETLQQYIDLNMTGIQESLGRILRGETEKVSVLRFGFDISSIGSDDELLTLFIHLGYLTYNVEDSTVSLPNKEIRMEFVEALRGSKTHKELSALIKTSDRLVEATMNRDERTVAEIIEHLHTSTAGLDYYNNEQALRSVLKIGYLSAIDDFVSIQELPTGKGYADLALIPRRGSRRPAVVIELKWNHPVEAAIDQIRRQQYPEELKHFADKSAHGGTPLLLVGITYNEKTKEHSCQIVQYPPC